MVYELMKLSYGYDSLESEIDEKTMIIHHTKHHQSYVDKLNKALADYPELRDKPILELVKDIESVSEEVRTAVRNNGGGVLNHDFFFSLLKKDVNISGDILEEINKKFGSFEEFKSKFIEEAMGVFGSGWTWLVLKNNELEIMNTFGHGNPVSFGATPLMVVDLWEHAYYLKYQNKRNEYLENFFKVINWDRVNEEFVKVKQ